MRVRFFHKMFPKKNKTMMYILQFQVRVLGFFLMFPSKTEYFPGTWSDTSPPSNGLVTASEPTHDVTTGNQMTLSDLDRRTM